MPQAQAYYPDGSAIPADKLGEALQKGEANFEEGARVHVTVGGKSGSVKAEDLPKLLARKDAGVLSPEQVSAREVAAKKEAELAPYQGIGSAALAQAEGHVEGVTFGGYGAVAELLAPGYSQRKQLRKEANPLAEASGELHGAIGSTVAGTLVGGGAAGVARTGGALEAAARAITAPARAVSAVGRGAEAVAGAGLRAAGYEGATALGRIGARGITGAVSGAAEGALLGAGHEVTSSIVENKPLTASRILSAGRTGALLGGSVGGILGAGSQAIGEAGKSVLGGVSKGRTFEEALTDYAEKRAFKGVTGNARKFYDEATDMGRNPERLNRIGRKLLDRGTPLHSGEAAVKAVDEQVDGAVLRLKTIASELDAQGVQVNVRAALQKVDDQVAKLRQVDLDDYQKVAKKLERKVAPLRASLDSGKTYGFGEFWQLRRDFDATIKWAQRKGSPAVDGLRDMRRHFDDALTESAEKTGSAGAWRAAKEDYADYRLVKDALDDLRTRNEKNRATSPSDYATGAMAFLGALTGGVSSLGALAGGVAVSQGHKYVRERGPGMVARLADVVAKSEKQTAQAVKAAVQGRAADLPRRIVAPAAQEVSEAARPFLPRDRKPDDFDRKAAEVIAWHANPQRAIETMTRATEQEDLDPELLSAIHASIARKTNFLLSRLPPSLQRADGTIGDSRIPAVEKAKWLREYAAVDDPETVLDDVAGGKFPRDAINAIRQTDPEQFADMQQRVTMELAAAGEAISFRRRTLLSLAFDIAGDKSLRGDRLAAIQAGFMPAQPAQPAPQGADISPQIATDMETTTQHNAA